jgi:hypothetical protein
MQTLRHIITVLLAVSILSGCSSSPSDETIKGDLIGRQVGEGRYTWKFESLSDFTAFSITNKVTQGDVIEYSATAKLKGTSGVEAAVDLRVVYRKESGVWKLANVRDTGALTDSLRGTPPPAGDVEKLLSQQAAQQSNGLIKVIGFTSSGGRFSENAPKIKYYMDGSLKIQFTDHCVYNHGAPLRANTDFNDLSSSLQYQLGLKEGQKGQTKTLKLNITFTRDVGEKKWNWEWNGRWD